MGNAKRARVRIMAAALGIGAAVMAGQGIASAEPDASNDPSGSSPSSGSIADSSEGSSSSSSSSSNEVAEASDESDDDGTVVDSSTQEPDTEGGGDEADTPSVDEVPESAEEGGPYEPAPTIDEVAPEPAAEVEGPGATVDTAEVRSLIEPYEQASDVASQANSVAASPTAPTIDVEDSGVEGSAETYARTGSTQAPPPTSIPEFAQVSSFRTALLGESVAASQMTLGSANSTFMAPATPTMAVPSLTSTTPNASLVAATGFLLWLGIPPLGGTAPVAPPPPAWALFAAVRRFATNTFANSTPTVTSIVVNPGQSTETGQITGKVNASDVNSDRLVYTVSSQGTKGTAVVDSNGNFTYTPNAATLETGGTDTFTVTVSDDTSAHSHFPIFFGGHTTSVPVTVTVDSTQTNSAPIVGASPTVGAPDPLTGAVTFTPNVTDPDGDTLTYTVISSTASTAGTLVDNGDGTVTYTPNSATMHAAAAPGGPTVETVTLSADDGNGATVSVSVTVPVVPANAEPTVGSSTVNNPDPSTGTVTGQVNVTDADGDTIVYSGSTTTPKGSVIVNGDGTFSYTPTADARRAAAADTATPADARDSFIITAEDGHGGTRTIFVSVPVDSPFDTVNLTAGRAETITLSPDGSRAYVTRTSSVLVIDTNTGAQLHAVSIDGEIVSMTFDESGDYAVISAYNSTTMRGTAVVFRNAENSSTSTTIDLDGRPGSAVFSADGQRAIVSATKYNPVDLTTATITVIDLDSGDYQAVTINNVSGPGAVAYSPDRQSAYVLSDRGTGDGRVTIIDLTSASVTSTLDFEGDPHLIRFGPDGSRAYVLSSEFSDNAGTVTVIDTTSNTVSATISLAGRPLDVVFFPNDDRAAIMSVDYQAGTNTWGNSGRVVVIDTSAGIASSTTPIAGRPTMIQVGPSGDRLYVTSYDSVASSSRLYVINASTGNAQITDSIGWPSHVVFSPGGERAFLVSHDPVSGEGELSIIDTATGTSVSQSPINGSLLGVGFSEDGGVAYVTTRADNDDAGTSTYTVTVVDTATGAVEGTPTAVTIAGLNGFRNSQISPDGRVLVVTALGAGSVNASITVIDSTTGTPTVVTRLPPNGRPSNVEFSPDGNRVYISSYSFTTRITTVRIVDRGPDGPIVSAVDLTANSFDIAVSDDGSKVYVARVDTSEPNAGGIAVITDSTYTPPIIV